MISLNSRRWKLLSFLHQLPPRGICPSVYSSIHPVIPLTIHSLTYSPTHPNTQPCIFPVIHASIQPSPSHSSMHPSILLSFQHLLSTYHMPGLVVSAKITRGYKDTKSIDLSGPQTNREKCMCINWKKKKCSNSRGNTRLRRRHPSSVSGGRKPS